MVPNKLKNSSHCCFRNFEPKLVTSKFFVEAVSILLLSFILSHFHKTSPTLLQEIYFLVFRMPNKWKLPEMNMDLGFD